MKTNIQINHENKQMDVEMTLTSSFLAKVQSVRKAMAENDFSEQVIVIPTASSADLNDAFMSKLRSVRQAMKTNDFSEVIMVYPTAD